MLKFLWKFRRPKTPSKSITMFLWIFSIKSVLSTQWAIEIHCIYEFHFEKNFCLHFIWDSNLFRFFLSSILSHGWWYFMQFHICTFNEIFMTLKDFLRFPKCTALTSKLATDTSWYEMSVSEICAKKISLAKKKP